MTALYDAEKRFNPSPFHRFNNVHDHFLHAEIFHRFCHLAFHVLPSALPVIHILPMISQKAAKTAQGSFPGRSPRLFTFGLLFPTFHRPFSRSGLLLDLRQGRSRFSSSGRIFGAGAVADTART